MTAPLARDIIEAIRGRRINYNPFPISITQPQFGAVADANGAGGGTDNSAAINNAMLTAQTLGLGSVLVPPGAYRCASGINHPTNVRLYSEGFIAGSPAAGTRFVFDLAVPTCYTIGSASLLSATLDGITITRSSGAIPAGCIGLLVNTGYNITITDVLSDRQGTGIKFYAAAPNGIAAMLTRVYTSGIKEDHVVIDGWAEMRWTQGRCGANGTNNFACNSYVRYDNTDGGATYPNGDFFDNVQFNQGNNPPLYWLDFVTVGTSSLEHKFTFCHVENLTSAYIHNSVNAVHIDRLSLNGNTLNTPVPFTSLVPATQINQWEIVGNEIAATTWDLSNVTAINGLIVGSNTISGCTATFNSFNGGAAPNATATFTGNNWFGGSICTFNGDKWTSLASIDATSSNSTIVNNTTGTGVVCLSPNQQSIAWAVALSGSPPKTKNVNYTTVLVDAGQTIYHTDGTARTYTIDSNANVPYVVGTMIHFFNDASAAVDVTIAITADTLVHSPSGTTGSHILAQYGSATAKKVAATRWVIWDN